MKAHKALRAILFTFILTVGSLLPALSIHVQFMQKPPKVKQHFISIILIRKQETTQPIKTSQ